MTGQNLKMKILNIYELSIRERPPVNLTLNRLLRIVYHSDLDTILSQKLAEVCLPPFHKGGWLFLN